MTIENHFVSKLNKEGHETRKHRTEYKQVGEDEDQGMFTLKKI